MGRVLQRGVPELHLRVRKFIAKFDSEKFCSSSILFQVCSSQSFLSCALAQGMSRWLADILEAFPFRFCHLLLCTGWFGGLLISWRFCDPPIQVLSDWWCT